MSIRNVRGYALARAAGFALAHRGIGARLAHQQQAFIVHHPEVQGFDLQHVADLGADDGQQALHVERAVEGALQVIELRKPVDGAELSVALFFIAVGADQRQRSTLADGLERVEFSRADHLLEADNLKQRDGGFAVHHRDERE